ncbi:MAG TPA: twin-arginine translocase TatA/TatE family subunit [Chloroflexi bacterium]|nr:twin-arginine translocase TatA/TatE family subunit [Chloroflexota bacterium]
MGSFSIGIGEVLLILVLVLLVFGPGKLPEIARGLGKGLRQFSKYSSGLTGELKNEFEKELNATPDTLNKSTTGGEGPVGEQKSGGTKAESLESQNRA